MGMQKKPQNTVESVFNYNKVTSLSKLVAIVADNAEVEATVANCLSSSQTGQVADHGR